jgi:putative membrane protein
MTVGWSALTAVARPVAWHGAGEPLGPEHVWHAWATDPLGIAFVVVAGALYALGLGRLWRSAGRAVRAREAWCFLAGVCVLAAALASPLHSLGGTLFVAHMTQHMLLMVVAAPLMVLGAPGLTALWAAPAAVRRRIGAALRSPWLRGPWRAVSAPAAAWAIHAAALWLWHAPALYERSVASPAVHTAQHVSFLGAALLFWWVAFHGRGGRREAAGVSLVYLFTTAVHASLLGALITFAGEPWYGVYGERASVWGLSPLEDQQLGGLVMWVPAGVVYVATFLSRFHGWIREEPGPSAALSAGLEPGRAHPEAFRRGTEQP